MDQQQVPPSAPLAPPPPPVPPPAPKSTNRLLLFLIILIILLSFGTAGFFAYQYVQLKNQASQPKPTPIPSPPGASAQKGILNWKTYTNTVQAISFKYPPNWTLTESAGQNENGNVYNTSITLSKDQAEIKMTFNLNGIGGQGQTYQGTQFILDGVPLYKYKTLRTYNNTWAIGLTDSITNSLGVFKNSGKTYSLVLTYPQTLDGTDLEREFELILSTFTFAPQQTQTTSPVIAFLPPLSLTERQNERDTITTRIINPFIDFEKDLDPSQIIASITIEDNQNSMNKSQYPYEFTAIFDSGVTHQALLTQTNGELDWYIPECMDCTLSPEFRQKYPEIATLFNQ